MGEDYERIRLDRHENGVRVLTLTDPDKRNAIGPKMRLELLAAAAELIADRDARVLVVTGEGSAYCAGADLNAIFAETGDPATVRENELSYYESFLWLRDLKIPTIAAVNGHAIGAGMNLALVCDVVVTGPKAKFGATFSKIGLHPGGGFTYFLTQRLGRGLALRTILRGDVISGQAAAQMGLADVFSEDPLAEALETASATANLEPRLITDIKHAVSLAETSGFEATVGYESWAQAASAYYPGVLDSIRAAGRSTDSPVRTRS
ncbi:MULTISPECIES: enoyl-CoA hydratase-related protein [unclassified Rhodococcus (in: high G+C Gram-positive bacteria)]